MKRCVEVNTLLSKIKKNISTEDFEKINTDNK